MYFSQLRRKLSLRLSNPTFTQGYPLSSVALSSSAYHNTRPLASPRAMFQDPPSDTEYDRSGTRTDFRSVPGGRNGSRVNMSSEGSGELSVRKPFFAISQIGVGSDLDRGSDDNDEGAYRPKTRRNDFGASGMLLPFAPYTGGGSTPNVGGGYHQDGQSQDPSRAFICLIISSTLVTSRAGVDIPDSSSRGHLGQHDRSGRSILPISLRLSNKDLGSPENLHGGDGSASDFDLPNMDGGALSRRESMQKASGTNVGHTTDDASCTCHRSPGLGPS